MNQTIPPALLVARPEAHLRSAGWIIRRALIGMFALSVFAIGGALLLHASIEPDGATIADQSE